MSDVIKAAIIGSIATILASIINRLPNNHDNNTISRTQFNFAPFCLSWIVSNILGLCTLGSLLGIFQVFILSKYIQNKCRWATLTTLGWIISIVIITLIFNIKKQSPIIGIILGFAIGTSHVLASQARLSVSQLIFLINTTLAWAIGYFVFSSTNWPEDIGKYVASSIYAGSIIGIITANPAYHLLSISQTHSNDI